jgi:hypothetical protein
MIKSALAALENAALFGAVRGNPASSHVEAGLRAYRAGGHDGVVAFGGGSALDAGKVVAFMSGQTRPLWDFEDVGDWWTRADPAGIAPVVAVPTTAGTGSEVGRAGVILNEETHQKKIIFHPQMMPRIVILDAELTVGLPRGVTAATGIDAFVHCFEAFCAPGFHPLADGVALEGMRLIHRYLPRACADGRDIEARAHMLAAASMGATAFQKGLGGVHAIAHPGGVVVQHASRTDERRHSALCHDLQPARHRRQGGRHCARARSAGARLRRLLRLGAAICAANSASRIRWRRSASTPTTPPSSAARRPSIRPPAAIPSRSMPRSWNTSSAPPWPAGSRRRAVDRDACDAKGPRILVIDGNVAEIRARQVAALGYDSGTGYARVLRASIPTLRIDIVPPRMAPQLAEGVGLEQL